jgi:prepilin signal peptidase PulO-like enzyme (type II secretory pathway)
MVEYLVLICPLVAIILLIFLSAIDLKHMILPDELNFGLAVCGVIFHLASGYYFMDAGEMVAGAVAGAGLLYVIRFFANRHYGRDALGLGDVKLLGAGGVWLGVEGVLQAVTIGAAAGLVHGLAYAALLSVRNKTPFTIRDLTMPAGPGFAIGIAVAGFILFSDYLGLQIHALLP